MTNGGQYDDFYPRPPRGGRPIRDVLELCIVGISIHALREEGDVALFCLRTLLLYFYPRPPRGGRPSPHFRLVRVHLFLSTPSARRATEEIYEKDKIQLFLSTPSARRATCCLFFLRQVDIISIHALREEGDLIRLPRFHCAPYFYPRPPRGGRRRTAAALAATRRFLSTPSARRATFPQRCTCDRAKAFLSTPSARRATKIRVESKDAMKFLSTPSARRATVF